MKNSESVKRYLICNENKVAMIVAAAKRGAFLREAKKVEVVGVVPDGWGEIDLSMCGQIRSGVRLESRESQEWDWKGVIEPYKVLATESGVTYNKCTGWENAPWGYDLVMPVGGWDKIAVEVEPSEKSAE